MRVDFYQLARDPAERVVPLLARKVLESGERLLVVSDDPAQRAAISAALWAHEAEAYLAHGHAGEPNDARQPVLLADRCEAANGASLALIADGRWREEAARFARVLLLFGGDTIEAARALWRELGAREGCERHYWQQHRGGWKKAG